MRKKSTSHSAFFNLRVVVGLILAVASVFLALVGFGRLSDASAQESATTPAQRFGETTVIHASHSDLSRPLREQPLVWPPAEIKLEATPKPKISHQPAVVPSPVSPGSFWCRTRVIP